MDGGGVPRGVHGALGRVRWPGGAAGPGAGVIFHGMAGSAPRDGVLPAPCAGPQERGTASVAALGQSEAARGGQGHEAILAVGGAAGEPSATGAAPGREALGAEAPASTLSVPVLPVAEGLEAGRAGPAGTVAAATSRKRLRGKQPPQWRADVAGQMARPVAAVGPGVAQTMRQHTPWRTLPREGMKLTHAEVCLVGRVWRRWLQEVRRAVQGGDSLRHAARGVTSLTSLRMRPLEDAKLLLEKFLSDTGAPERVKEYGTMLVLGVDHAVPAGSDVRAQQVLGTWLGNWGCCRPTQQQGWHQGSWRAVVRARVGPDLRALAAVLLRLRWRTRTGAPGLGSARSCRKHAARRCAPGVTSKLCGRRCWALRSAWQLLAARRLGLSRWRCAARRGARKGSCGFMCTLASERPRAGGCLAGFLALRPFVGVCRTTRRPHWALACEAPTVQPCTTSWRRSWGCSLPTARNDRSRASW
jgi:hypothetical protein